MGLGHRPGPTGWLGPAAAKGSPGQGPWPAYRLWWMWSRLCPAQRCPGTPIGGHSIFPGEQSAISHHSSCCPNGHEALDRAGVTPRSHGQGWPHTSSGLPVLSSSLPTGTHPPSRDWGRGHSLFWPPSPAPRSVLGWEALTRPGSQPATPSQRLTICRLHGVAEARDGCHTWGPRAGHLGCVRTPRGTLGGPGWDLTLHGIGESLGAVGGWRGQRLGQEAWA